MSEFYSIITTKGFEVITDALCNERKLNLTHIAVGDGGGDYYEPNPEQTELVNEYYRAPISEVTALVTKAQIPNDIGGFYIREVGVYDENGNLVLIAKHPETYKPIISEGSAKELWIKVVIKAINPDVLELKLDPTIQCASVQLVTDLLNIHTHKDLMPIALYDTNYNGYVDTCDYIDGGLFVGDADEPELENPNPDIFESAGQGIVIPNEIMNINKYDTNNNGIVDNAENIDAGEF